MPIIYKNGNIYGGASSADDVSFDDTTSGLSATNVQDAIDEVVSDVSDKADKIVLPDEYDATSTYNLGDFVTYQGDVYICIYTIITAEAWNSNHWKLTDADQSYLHSLDPKGAGSFSFNRKANTTIGICSFAEGYYTTASGGVSHAEGNSTTASGYSSHAEGYNTTASFSYSHAEGSGTTASGDSSHAEGHDSVASGDSSHAEGNYTTASGRYSHAEGNYTTANHKSQHTFGEYNVLDDSTATASNRGNYVEIVGNGTGTSARSNARTLDWSGNEVLAGDLTINGTTSVTTSLNNKADRVPEPAEYSSSSTYALGDFCTYDGNTYVCKDAITTAEAWNADHWLLCAAQHDYLHSLDPVCNGSFSMNRFTNIYNPTGKFSFTEGYYCVASGDYSHAEGLTTRASASYSHTEGLSSMTGGMATQAHAEGYATQALGPSSHAEGYYTKARNKSQHVFGEFNVEDPAGAHVMSRGLYVEIVGNGTADDARSNARTLDWDGNEVLAGGLKINNTQDVAAQVSLTQDQYDALVSAGTVDLVNTIYFITDADAVAGSAAEITYSNTTSGLSATNVQGAIDELESGKADISTPIQNLTCPRCAISSFDAYKIQKIGNIIFFSVELTFGATSETGAVYFLSALVDNADFVQGSLFDDLADTGYQIYKGRGGSLWLRNGNTGVAGASLVNKTRMFLNLIIFKAT